MTLTELRYIIAVARYRHFGKAAEACCISQPTLSVGVRKLEEELGVRLFERSRSDVIVTAIGETIVKQAKAVMLAADEIRQTASAVQDPLGQTLALGVIYTIGPYLVPRLIASLKDLAPDLSLIVKENFTDALALELRQGEIDAAIMSLPFETQGIVSRPLYNEPFKAALPADHPLARKKHIRTSELRKETVLLLGTQNCFRDQVIEACPAFTEARQGNDGSLATTLVGSSLETICQMVSTGAGVTILPSTMRITEELNDYLAIRPLAPPAPHRTVAIFYRRGFARQAVIDCVAHAVRKADLATVTYCD